jgi:hypothetical protein
VLGSLPRWCWTLGSLVLGLGAQQVEVHDKSGTQDGWQHMEVRHTRRHRVERRDLASERTGVAAQRSGMPPGSNGETSRPLGSRTGQASRRRGH